MIHWHKPLPGVRQRPDGLAPVAARWAVCLAGALVIVAPRAASAEAEVDTSLLPPPAKKQVDFSRDIQPILEHTCLRCHGVEKPKSNFQLISAETALKGGKHGIDIIRGHSEKSPLIHYVARLVPDMEMPPEGKGEPLTADQVALMRAWIDQGPLWSAAPLGGKEQFKFSVSPTFAWIHVDGNKQQFRAHSWQHENASGGVENFSLQEQIDNKTTVTADGRALFGKEDFRVQLQVDRRDVGFIRLGAERYRKWFEDTGAYEPIFHPAIFRLDRDLHLDLGRAWFDAGLSLPNWPHIVLGYEYQNKEGNEATLHRGDVTAAGGTDKKIFPAARGLHEQVHIMKLDVTHDLAGVHLENDFRAELYDLDSRRLDPLLYNADAHTLDKEVFVRETQNHFQAANTIHLEKQWREWLFVSGGYLYSQLNGEAAFSQTTFLPPGSSGTIFPDDKFWSAPGILLEQSSHLLNANALLGPWDGLSLQSGVQVEWMRQKSAGDVRLDEGIGTAFAEITPAHLDSNLDRTSVQEMAGLRYTRIPFTVLFADVRLEQERIGDFAEQMGGHDDFLRDTDARSDLEDLKTGFTLSPWTRVALDVQYKYRDRRTDYNHLRDEANGAPNPGYPGFIRRRDLETDEVAAKLILRWSQWFKTTLSYRVTATDYSTATDPFVIPALILPGLPPLAAKVVTTGADHQAGDYDSHIYGLDATVTPIARLHLTGAFSYQQNRTRTDHPGLPAVVDYRGGVYSAVGTAFFNLNAKTDLKASYHFSWANYAQNHFVEGLPLGIKYSRHGLEAGMARRLTKNITGHLQYAFFRYDEPTAGGANNYTAHGVFTTLSIILP